MDIIWYGQACFKIKGKQTSILIDPYDPQMIGLKLPKDTLADIVMVTHDHPDHNNLAVASGDAIQITGPGEYEIKGIAITGVGVYHDKQKGAERGKNTVYSMHIDGLNIVHVGDLGHQFTQEQIEEIGSCDILMVPVGGNYTIDAGDAAEVVAQLEPRIILPMHYAQPGLKVELASVEPFLKQMGAENVSTQPKLTITKDKLPEEPQVIVLTKV